MTCWTENIPELPGIYKLTNKINGKIYIGKSRDLKYRTNSYKKRSYTDRPFQSALNKYGREGFKIEAIEIFPQGTPDKTLLTRETFWIKFFKAANYKFGYNGTECSFDERGEGFRKRKAEIRELKRKNQWNFTRPIKENQQTSCLKNWTTSKPVNQLDKKTGEFIKTWNSATEASIAITGRATSKSTISSVARGKYAKCTAIGFKWEYAKVEKKITEIPEEIRKSWSEKRRKENLSEETCYKIGSATRGKKIPPEVIAKRVAKTKGQKRPTICVPILQICPKTLLILKKWESATHASIELYGTVSKRNHIGLCLRGAAKTALGFIWKREKDYV